MFELSDRGFGWVAYKHGTRYYMRKNRLKAFFRGHQHFDFGLKLFGKGHEEFHKFEDKLNIHYLLRY